MTTDLDPRIARSRSKVLAAATELLTEGGVRSVTADAVAELSGVAKSTIYRHWSSVDELMLEVFRCNVPSPGPVSLDAGFEAGLRSWMRQVVASMSSADWRRILPVLMELRNKSPEMAQLLDHDFEDKLETIASILALGAQEGRVPKGLDPRVVTQALAGPLVLAALSGDDTDLPGLADFVVERFLASYP